MLDISKVRAVLDTASRWDMDLDQFACWSHAHLFNPVLHYGQYQITNEGCSGDIFIILNGSHRGYIHCATADCDAGLAFREPRTFATYKEDYLKRTFADYFMEYVNRTEDVCNNLSAEKRQKFQRERAQVRDFLAAVQAGDWDGVVKLLNAIEDPAALSTKSKSLYIHYDENHLLRPLSTNPAVKRFYDQLYGRHGRNYGNWLTWVRCYDPANTRIAPYPRPTFEAFAQTFFDP